MNRTQNTSCPSLIQSSCITHVLWTVYCQTFHLHSTINDFNSSRSIICWTIGSFCIFLCLYDTMMDLVSQYLTEVQTFCTSKSFIKVYISRDFYTQTRIRGWTLTVQTNIDLNIRFLFNMWIKIPKYRTHHQWSWNCTRRSVSNYIWASENRGLCIKIVISKRVMWIFC